MEGCRKDEDITGAVSADNRFEALFVRNPLVAVQGFDPAGVVLHWNAASESLYGYLASEAVGRRIQDLLLEPADIPDFEQTLAYLCATGETLPPREWETRTGSGGRRFVYSTMVPVRENGTVVEIFCTDVDTTDRHETQEMLRRSEEHYRHLIENANDIVCSLDLEGRFTFVSPAVQHLLGYEPQELIGRLMTDFLDPAEKQRVDEALERRRSGTGVGDGLTLELIYQCKDGRPLVMEVRTSPVRDNTGQAIEILGIARDITERRRAEEALQESRERYHALFNAVVDAVLVHEVEEDGPGKIVAVNDIACQRLGYTREELLGMSVRDIDAPESTVDVATVVRELRAGRDVLFEQTHVTRDGRRIPVEVHTRGFSLRGRTLVLSVSRDISERRQAEAARRDLEDQVRHAQKLESLGVLAGGIAHDFNNILMAVLGHASLLGSRLDAASPLNRHVLEIEKASRRAADLCRQLLAYSGRGRIEMRPIQLGDMVQDMADMLRISISKKAEIRFDLAPGLPSVMGDLTQLRQVIMNLVVNASEALSNKQGVVRLATGVRWCACDFFRDPWMDRGLAAGDYAYFEVSDEGCGMDEATCSRIFDPFFSTKFPGRGLGLAAVLGIVRGHKGAIQVRSEPGIGSTFRVFLPVCGDEARPVDDAAPATRDWKGSGLMLLVDDEEIVRTVGGDMLRFLGFDVITAGDGVEAIRLFRERQGDIVCVLLDLTMPKMDGEETLREIRAIRPDARVIMSSGYSEQELVQRAVREEVTAFLQKPYQLDILAATLREAFEPGSSDHA